MKTTNYSLLLFFATALLSAPHMRSATAPTTTSAAPAAAPQQFNLGWKETAVVGALGASAALLWAFSQHAHSKIGHSRYPLMQRRNIIRAQLSQKLDTAERETLTSELAEINYRMQRLQARKSRLHLLRILGGLGAITGLPLAGYGIHKNMKAQSKKA
jgi:hypothetical protein